jgi:ABC-type sugar transport system permease subunit
MERYVQFHSILLRQTATWSNHIKSRNMKSKMFKDFLVTVMFVLLLLVSSFFLGFLWKIVCYKREVNRGLKYTFCNTNWKTRVFSVTWVSITDSYLITYGLPSTQMPDVITPQPRQRLESPDKAIRKFTKTALV